MNTVSIEGVEELEGIAEEVLDILSRTPERHVVTLKGDLGAGKTAFTKVLARGLHISEEVTSPTFVIMKSYPISGHAQFSMLTHIDAYRIEDEEELRILGLGALIEDPRTLIVIEWPERILGLIPNDALSVSIMITADNARLITYGD